MHRQAGPEAPVRRLGKDSRYSVLLSPAKVQVNTGLEGKLEVVVQDSLWFEE